MPKTDVNLEKHLNLLRIYTEVTSLNSQEARDFLPETDEISYLINFSGNGDIEAYADELINDPQVVSHIWEIEKTNDFIKKTKKYYRKSQLITHPDHQPQDKVTLAETITQSKNLAWEELSTYQLPSENDFCGEKTREFRHYRLKSEFKALASYAKDMADIAVIAAQKPRTPELQAQLNKKLLQILDRQDDINHRNARHKSYQESLKPLEVGGYNFPPQRACFKRIMATLEAGADINTKSSSGETAYQLVLKYRFFSSDLTKKLTDFVLDPSKTPFTLKPTETGTSNLRTAIKEGSGFFLADTFLEQGDDPLETDADGWTSLHEAIKQGSLTASVKLIERGADINAPHKEGTPFYLAVGAFDEDYINFLIEKGADTNYKHYYSLLKPNRFHTPLSKALISKQKIPKYSHKLYLKMIKAGADVNTIEIPSETSNQHSSMIALFKREKAKRGLSFFDHPICPIDDVEELLALGANPALLDSQGMSILEDAKAIKCPQSFIDELEKHPSFQEMRNFQNITAATLIAGSIATITALFTAKVALSTLYTASLGFVSAFFNPLRRLLPITTTCCEESETTEQQPQEINIMDEKAFCKTIEPMLCSFHFKQAPPIMELIKMSQSNAQGINNIVGENRAVGRENLPWRLN